MKILDQAAAWLERRGVHQWPNPHRPHHWKRVGEAIQRGEVYLIRTPDEIEPVGTISLTFRENPAWPDGQVRAAYIQRMAVRDRYHGQMIGREAVEWAAHITRESGYQSLRLDCQARNRRLCEYYESLGFVSMGQLIDRDYTARLYAREISRQENSSRSNVSD